MNGILQRGGLRLRVALVASVAAGGIVLLALALLRSVLVGAATERSDRELAQLAVSALKREHGPNHFKRFEESLLLVAGGDEQRFALRVEDSEGRELHRSANWPAEFTTDRMPSAGPLRSRPVEGGHSAGAEQLLAPREPAFGDVGLGHTTWRVIAAGSERHRLWLAINATAFLSSVDAELARIFWVAVPVFAAVCVLVWWLSGRALAPLREFSAGLEAFGARSLDRRLGEGNCPAELQPLTRAFNQLLDRLERSFTQASRFSADASHELRTPLTLLQLQAEESLRRAPDGSEWQVSCERLLTDIAGLRDTLEKLLLLSRADAGRLGIQPVNEDARALCEEVLEDLRMLAPERNVTARLAPVGLVAVDAVLIRRLLLNLAANAARHTPPGGSIELTIQRTDGRVRFRICNSGDGIDPNDVPRIFERFFRGSRARAGSGSGTGLGLAIAREIAWAHGGQLALVCAQPATFELELPSAGPA